MPPVFVGTTVVGYVGLATYNLLGNDLARFANVTVHGQEVQAPPPFICEPAPAPPPPPSLSTNNVTATKSAGSNECVVQRGFQVLTVPVGGENIDSRHVSRMVRAPNGDL